MLSSSGSHYSVATKRMTTRQRAIKEMIRTVGRWAASWEEREALVNYVICAFHYSVGINDNSVGIDDY